MFTFYFIKIIIKIKLNFIIIFEKKQFVKINKIKIDNEYLKEICSYFSMMKVSTSVDIDCSIDIVR